MSIASVTIKLTDGTTATFSSDGTTPISNPTPTPTPSQSQSSVDFGGHHWTLGGPHLGSPGNFDLLKDGAFAAGGGGIGYYVSGGQLYVETIGFGWFLWNGSEWVPSINPTLNPTPTPTPTIPATATVTLPNGMVTGWAVDWQGAQYRLSATPLYGAWAIMRNGVIYKGAANRLLVAGEFLYLRDSDGGWWRLTADEWKQSPDPTVGITLPPVDWTGHSTQGTVTPAPVPVDPPPAGASFTPNAPLSVQSFASLSPWFRRVDQDAVHPQSAAIIQSVVPVVPSLGHRFHPDFGPGAGMKYAVGRGYNPAVIGPIQYPAESDLGPYPIPLNAPIGGEGNMGDMPLLYVDDQLNKLYELWFTQRTATGFSCGSAAVWDLTKGYDQRPLGWTSGDASGMSILPGLVKVHEMATALAQPNPEDRHLGHALRFTLPMTGRGFIAPARHYASTVPYALPGRPPMGMRIRMNPAMDLTPFNPPSQVLMRTMQLYGAILADNGAAFFVSGTDDAAWDQWFEQITGNTGGIGFKMFSGSQFDSNIQVLNWNEADVVLPE